MINEFQKFNFMSLNTRSLFTLMTLSLFAISFTMISDAQTVYGIEVSPPQKILTEDDFDSVGIIDVQTNENGIYLLYYDKGFGDILKFTSSFDEGSTWSTPIELYEGFDTDFSQTISQHIFISDNGDIGVGWANPDPMSIFFAEINDDSSDFILVTDEFEEFDEETIGVEIVWSGDGDNIAIILSDSDDQEFQAVIVSNDFGKSWTGPTFIQSDDEHDISGQNQGLIEVNGDKMFATWSAIDGGENVYFSKSDDNGVTWDDPTQINTSAISESSKKLLVNEDGSNVIISWIDSTDQKLIQSVSIDGGAFSLPTLIDNGVDAGDCDNEYDIDYLGDDVIFMCLGFDESERFVKLSNDFGSTYSTNYKIVSNEMTDNVFPENIGTSDSLFSLWVGNVDNIKYLSISDDKGETFNFELLPDLEEFTITNGLLSRQVVLDDNYYWFSAHEQSISFVKVVTEIPTDHYLGYKAKVEHEDKHAKLQVTLVDEFAGKVEYDVKKLKKLYNPVAKNGEPIANNISHLVSYDIKKSHGEPKFKGIKNILVSNQFGELTVDIKKVKVLLVPSSKDHFAVPDPLDPIEINHFKCYDAKVSKHTPKFEKRNVDLVDQFGSLTMEVKKQKMLCSPVDKNDEGIVNDENYVMCYDLKKIKGEPKFKKINVFTNNQFGPEELEVKKPKTLCVPSTILDNVEPETEPETEPEPETELETETETETEPEPEPEPEPETEPFSGSFIGKQKNDGTWKSTGKYMIDDDKYNRVKTSGIFSLETVDECKQISASGTIKLHDGNVNANFDLQKCGKLQEYIGTFVITGGTIKYEGATGSGDVTIKGSMKHFKGNLNGEISIPT